MMGNADRSNAQRFLDAFHAIELSLRRSDPQQGRPRKPFYRLVDDSRALAAGQKQKLKELADLRNVIVHNPYDGLARPIADPRDDAVEWIEAQAEVIENPPLVRNVLKLKPPVVLDEADDISKFFAQVASPLDFSQAPVRANDGTLQLVTTNAVARWVASSYEADQGAIIMNATIRDVLNYSEQTDTLRLAPTGLRSVEAIRMFAGEAGMAPAAIVITQAGKQAETPLGICVRADVSDLLKSLRI